MYKVSWNDLNEATHKELKLKYKLNDRELEKQVRYHLDGASPDDRRDIYEKVWYKKG